METFNLYSIKDLNSDMSCEKVDVIGIICRSFVSEPRRCKNGGKYFLSFTLKGTFHCFLMSGKIYYHIKVRLKFLHFGDSNIHPRDTFSIF